MSNSISFFKILPFLWNPGFPIAILILSLFSGFFFTSFQNFPVDLSQSLEGPSLNHLFGCDENGMDVFVQVIYGLRISLLLAFAVVFINLIIGVSLGGISGWRGGHTDNIIMRTVDVLASFPRFLLALTILATVGSSVFHLILAFCVTGWINYARLVRAEVFHIKKTEYVLAAKCLGAHPIRIFIHHILPNLTGILSVQTLLSLIAVVLAESGLSFLGLGLPIETPSMGRLLQSGRAFLEEAPHLTIFPGAALFILILSFHLLGETVQRRNKIFPSI